MSDESTEVNEQTDSTETEQKGGQKPDEPMRLPDDHPLVTTLAAQKETIRDLKAQIETASSGSKTAEQRIADLEGRVQKAEHTALVKSVQAAHGISDEDADLFLTGSDKATLTKQAERLASKSPDRKQSNHVPREGNNPQSKPGPDREFLHAILGKDQH